MSMGAPKKPVNKKVDPKSAADDDDDSILDQKSPKKIIEEDDDDFDGPLDDIGYSDFDEFDEEDDY
jgi:hypothetical protein